MPNQTIKVQIPLNVQKMQTLADNVLKKHAKDGNLSPLPNNIMQQMQAVYTQALAKNEEQIDLKKEAERLTESRNLTLGTHITQNSYTPNTVTFYVRAIRDYLLGIYRGKERELGAYGYVVNSPLNEIKIEIPRNAEELSRLADIIVKKHAANGANSLIPAVLADGLIALVAQANLLVEQAAQVARDGETATQSRNLLLGIAKGQTSKTVNTIRFYLSSVRDILLGLYREQPQRLGDWGFEVNSSTAAANSNTDTNSDTAPNTDSVLNEGNLPTDPIDAGLDGSEQ